MQAKFDLLLVLEGVSRFDVQSPLWAPIWSNPFQR